MNKHECPVPRPWYENDENFNEVAKIYDTFWQFDIIINFTTFGLRQPLIRGMLVFCCVKQAVASTALWTSARTFVFFESVTHFSLFIRGGHSFTFCQLPYSRVQYAVWVFPRYLFSTIVDFLLEKSVIFNSFNQVHI